MIENGFIHHHLRQYHGEIDEGNHFRVALCTLEVTAKETED